nr:thioesterase family protein [uncultured Cupriavidus sp.]
MKKASNVEALVGRFSSRLKLRNADTDQFRHVNNAAVATLLEEARMAIFTDDGLSNCMHDKHVVVVHLAIDFIAEIFYPGEIEVRTMPVSAGNTSFELTQALYAGEKLCARASATCVLMDSNQSRPTPLPQRLRQHLAPPAPVTCGDIARSPTGEPM